MDRHTLIVMRHGKAGELPGGPDFERALRPRGHRDSEAAGRWLLSQDVRPDAVICSAARRTRQTWQSVAAGLGYEPAVMVDRQLYHADAEDLIEIIRLIDPAVSSLVYVGHNPAAARLVGLLTGNEPPFPTAATAVLAVAGDWPDLAPGDAELTAMWTPRTGDG